MYEMLKSRLDLFGKFVQVSFYCMYLYYVDTYIKKILERKLV